MEKITLNDITLDQAVDAAITPSAEYSVDQIGPGKKVILHFELALLSGEIIDSNFSKAPAEFSVGDGSLLPGFEQALFGMKAGQEKTVTLAARQAFGESRQENIQKFSRYRFPADLAMEKGLMISFTDKDGNDQPGIIQEFDANRVEIDFNHPLSDRDIVFKVNIHAVSQQAEQSEQS